MAKIRFSKMIQKFADSVISENANIFGAAGQKLGYIKNTTKTKYLFHKKLYMDCILYLINSAMS